jgi:cytochrome oxidase Cu insertion factor (SCO1/SenC/PrrC family)
MTRVTVRLPGQLRQVLAVVAGLTALTALSACGSSTASHSGQGGMGGMGGTQQSTAESNPDLDPGTSLNNAAAPDFRLTNQFGQQVSLSAFRGKVVILAFADSECTTVCPLTTVSMLEAKQMLGRAGQNVQLLGVDANPDATAVSTSGTS